MTDFNPKEFKVVALRECPVPESMLICETPDQAADYWRLPLYRHPHAPRLPVGDAGRRASRQG